MQNNQLTGCQLGLCSKLLLILAILGICLATVLPLWSQEKHDPERRVVKRVEPEYPATLKRLYIGGVVRVEVVVAASGSTESMQLVGGNPILGQSAMKAIQQWKFAPSTGKSTFIVPLTFDPHQ
jgi:periplasmic protein TonB